MNPLFESAGVLSLGSRIRALGERLADHGRRVYAERELDLEPVWFPVMFHLRHHREASVTDLAEAIGQSHASVSQMSRAMQKRGVVASRPSPDDGRVRLLSLSDTGRAMVPAFDALCDDVRRAADDLLAGMSSDVWGALTELEHELDREPFDDRVRRQRKARQAHQAIIRPFRPGSDDARAFVALNTDWIREYFALEPADEALFSDVDRTIIDLGGAIFMAELDGRIVGTCALMNHGDGVFELAKMAVEREARGRNLGYLLGQRIVDEARNRNGRMIFIESNTILKPAIQLYYKLGFRKVAGHTSPYSRSNIYMELALSGA